MPIWRNVPIGDCACKTDLGRWKLPSSTASIRHPTGGPYDRCGVHWCYGGEHCTKWCVSRPKIGHVLTDVLQAVRCGMSTSSFLSPLYHLGRSSSSPVCSGTSAFGAIFDRSPLDTDTIYRLYATCRDHLEPFTAFCFAFLCHWVLDHGLLRRLPTRCRPLERDLLGAWTGTGLYGPSSRYVRRRDRWLVFVQGHCGL